MGLHAYQQLLGELSGLELGSLNETPADDAGMEALALLPAGPEDDPFLQCQSSEMRRLLAEAIAGLPERERMVLTLYYYEELTMREVGATMGVVESRVSQLALVGDGEASGCAGRASRKDERLAHSARALQRDDRGGEHGGSEMIWADCSISSSKPTYDLVRERCRSLSYWRLDRELSSHSIGR